MGTGCLSQPSELHAAGAIAYVTMLFAKTGKQWIVSAVLGLATGIVDFYVHSGMFGSVATEAVVTGVAAAALSYLVGTVIQRYRATHA